MIVTSTPSVEGRAIAACRGLVTGAAILGAKITGDILAGSRDIFGGRSAARERDLARARETALAEREARAAALGARAFAGVDLAHEGASAVLMVSASGTALALS
ncbi:MAG: heavy metal-binding domain-containing protein [Defluviimonas sp.]|uniref:heavy metal-binding domain-containing protein n=1 Tax=Albidovulum sp. TaxID=1872424 RepID=UPI002A256399|nr:heavy metal-binding domain-containing protein [Defluviimonas sp.]